MSENIKRINVEESDIDIVVIGKSFDIDLAKFEDILKRKISLHFVASFQKLEKEMKNSIINGLTLSGYLKVF